MIKKLRKIGAMALSIMLIVSSYNVALATNFRDVGDNLSWARQAIETVTELGIMQGDLAGNFNPNGPMDKFEAVRVFARMSGFNPSNLTTQQIQHYEAIYQTHSNQISVASAGLTRWNASVNREIAYLLHTGVLTPSDLGNFIVIENETERLRAVSREEMAVFLVRFMGRQQQAIQNTQITLFADDSLISPFARPSVYYLRSLGILNGSDNRVDPRAVATRAAIAMLINATLHEIESPLLGLTPSPGASNVSQISGTIANVFAPFRSIQTTSTNPAHNNRILPVTTNAIITIGGINSSFADLTTGMAFNATLNAGGEIVQLVIGGATNQQPQPTPIAPPTASPSPTPIPINEANIRTLDGTVARVNVNNNTIGIEIRMINPRGEIITETRDYGLASNVIINRHGGTNNLALSAVTVGDLAVVQIYNNLVINIQLEERVRNLTGVLIEKNFMDDSMFPILVIQDADGVNHRFSVAHTSDIRRHNLSNLSARHLRIGDTVTLRAEFGRITEAVATGTTSISDVYIRAIFISGREQSHIIVSDTAFGAVERKHLVVDGTIDVHTLQIGSFVRLWLDSQEVTAVQALPQSAANTNFTWQIINISATQITVRDDNFNQRMFNFDTGTLVISAITGQNVPLSSIMLHSRVHITTVQGNNNRANTITILSN